MICLLFYHVMIHSQLKKKLGLHGSTSQERQSAKPTWLQKSNMCIHLPLVADLAGLTMDFPYPHLASCSICCNKSGWFVRSSLNASHCSTSVAPKSESLTTGNCHRKRTRWVTWFITSPTFSFMLIYAGYIMDISAVGWLDTPQFIANGGFTRPLRRSPSPFWSNPWHVWLHLRATSCCRGGNPSTPSVVGTLRRSWRHRFSFSPIWPQEWQHQV